MKKKALRLRIQQEKEIIQKMQTGQQDITLSNHPKAYHEGRLSILEEIQTEQTMEYLDKKMKKKLPKRYQCPVCSTPFTYNGTFSVEEHICPKCGWTLINTATQSI